MALAGELNSLRMAAGAPSLRKLADMTGQAVSHTTIAAAFKGRVVPRWEVVQRIVDALHGDTALFQRLWREAAADTPPVLTDEERRDTEYTDLYRRYVLRRYESLIPAVPGLHPEISLRDIYVPLTIVDRSGETFEEVQQAEFEERIGKALLLGAPGSGKSTLCEHLMYTHAARGDDVVFLLSVRDLVPPSSLPSLVTELIELELEVALQARPPHGFVERLLLNGSPLVIFDGLDEADIPQEARRATAIVDAFATQHPLARILITSRPLEAERIGHGLTGFSRFTLEEFNDRQTATFVRAWFASMGDEPERNHNEEEEFLRQIASTSWIRPNPLLLTLVCSLSTIRPEPESMYSLLQESLLSRSDAISKGVATPKGSTRGVIQLSMSQDDLTRRLRDGHWPPSGARLAEAILQQFQRVEPSDRRGAKKAKHSEPLEILQIRRALEKEFSGLIDMGDMGSSSDLDVFFLARALAALVVRRQLRCGSAMAAASIVDGINDNGLDAIAVSDGQPEILLVQSKWDWGRSGRKIFGLTDVLKFEQALRLLISEEYDQFNTKFQRHADQVADALAHPACTIKMIIVTVGHAHLDPGAVAGLERMKQEFNSFGNILDYEVWDARRVWKAIRDDIAPEIKVSANMTEWIHLADPFEAYQGKMSVADVAQWYEEHHDRLFAQNIRTTLRRTHTQSIVDTLATKPENFWYFNNGITVLCETAVRHQWSHAPRMPIALELTGACVVNGTQTVAAIHAAMQEAPEMAARAYVSVKVIITKNSPSDFKAEIARAANAQYPVMPHDFLALDLTQQAIRKGCAPEQGEADSAPDS
ncbi:AIPR family protein [Streptosporangium sp. NBC_01469]|uniref:AIPR family protein n=1 Tax=Streptosporangium sp. NBC_01469 TaxID=2903898 RepID=UPI002E2C1896|nr:AIPR family protein [Streptosporangium sp. NBC_01469]